MKWDKELETQNGKEQPIRQAIMTQVGPVVELGEICQEAQRIARASTIAQTAARKAKGWAQQAAQMALAVLALRWSSTARKNNEHNDRSI